MVALATFVLVGHALFAPAAAAAAPGAETPAAEAGGGVLAAAAAPPPAAATPAAGHAEASLHATTHDIVIPHMTLSYHT